MPESNLGYPFSVGASSVGYGQGWLSSTSGAALAATLHVMLFPWNIILRWISWVATLALSGLAAIGATPQGFIPVTKVGGKHIVTFLWIAPSMVLVILRSVFCNLSPNELRFEGVLTKSYFLIYYVSNTLYFIMAVGGAEFYRQSHAF